jgi:hypothetical protein
MNNKTVLMAAVIAVATVLAAGLAVLPNPVQEAQANPCATEVEQDAESEQGSNALSTEITSDNDQRECNFIGPVELDED